MTTVLSPIDEARMGRFQKQGRVRRPASDNQGFAARGEREADQNSPLVLPHHRCLPVLIYVLL